MSVLTNEEISQIYCDRPTWDGFARAVEQAVLEKLKQQDPVGAVLVKRESREGVMFYSADMLPDPTNIKDKFELVTVYAAPIPDVEKQQEPVAWHFCQNGYWHFTDEKRDWYDAPGVEEVIPLYATPVLQEDAEKQRDELLAAIEPLAELCDNLCRWYRRFDEALVAVDTAIAAARGAS